MRRRKRDHGGRRSEPRNRNRSDPDRGRRRKHQRRRHPLGPGQPDRRRRSHLRPLQGRRLLRSKLHRNPDRDPRTVTGDGGGNGQYTSENFDTGSASGGAGTYHWIAHFSGDANNKAVDGECDDENETTVVEEASPEIETEATPTAIVGENINDVATLSGLVSPTGDGEVTFDLYKGADCSEENFIETLTATPDGRPATVGANGNYTSENFDTGRQRRRRHLPLDRPLLRRRQQQSGRRRMRRRERDHGSRRSEPRNRNRSDPDRDRRRKHQRRRHPHGPGQPDRRRRSHLRPLQGHRLLRTELHRNPDRDPRTSTGDRSAPTAPTPLRTSTPAPPRRRRHLPLDRPLLRRRQQQSGRRRLPRRRTRPRWSKKRAPKSPPKRPRPRSSAKTSTTSPPSTGLVSPTGAGEVTFDLYKGADCSEPKLHRHPERDPRQPGTAAPTAPSPRRTSTPTPPRRRRHLPLDRPLLRRRQQQSRRRRLPRRRTRTRRSKKRPPNSPPKRPPTAIVGENINDVATLTGPGQRDRRRRSHLRPLQGRRLLRRKTSATP